MHDDTPNTTRMRDLMRFDSIGIAGVIHSVQQAQLDSDGLPVLGPDGQPIISSLVSFSPEGDDYADAISYTVQYNDPRGGVVLVPGVVPINPRWPRPLKVQAARDGTGVLGVMLSFRDGSPPIVQFTIHELPGMKACGGKPDDDPGDDDPGDDDPPPPPPAGVCCIDGQCVSNTNQADCEAVGGRWIPGATCQDMPPPCGSPTPPHPIDPPPGFVPRVGGSFQ